MGNLSTPKSVQKLQTALHAKAKAEAGYRSARAMFFTIRRLVDANIIGIFIWNLEGQILEANDALLRIIGYDREALVFGRKGRHNKCCTDDKTPALPAPSRIRL